MISILKECMVNAMDTNQLLTYLNERVELAQYCADEPYDGYDEMEIDFHGRACGELEAYKNVLSFVEKMLDKT